MAQRSIRASNPRVREAKRQNATIPVRSSQRARPASRRGHVGPRNVRLPFAPPEDWYESTGTDEYSIVAQPPGPGYRHVLKSVQIRERLSQLPKQLVDPLEVVQLSQMTRKKQTFPCYGMQWGTTIYLYPLEESLEETFHKPPRPALFNEAKMYGGRWTESSRGVWTLHWSDRAIQDYYLNNILLHELGHLLDDRNSSYTDRERYAEWFAIEHGYRATGGAESRAKRQTVRRRHHAC